MTTVSPPPISKTAGTAKNSAAGGATDCPRAYLGHEFVYLYVAARSHGLAIGINLNPDAACNFDCLYCDVDRRLPPSKPSFNADQMAAELRETLEFVEKGGFAGLACYKALPKDLQATIRVHFKLG